MKIDVSKMKNPRRCFVCTGIYDVPTEFRKFKCPNCESELSKKDWMAVPSIGYYEVKDDMFNTWREIFKLFTKEEEQMLRNTGIKWRKEHGIPEDP